MTITIDLAPEEEQNLRQQAEMAGQDVAAYLLTCAGVRRNTPPPLSHEEWDVLLDEMGDSIPADVPPLSDYAVSREGIYEGRY